MQSALLLFFISFQLNAAPQVVSQSVGMVGDKIVTSREVQVSAILEKVIEKAKSDYVPTEMKISDPKFAVELNALLLETVIAQEAASFNVGQVSANEEKAMLERVEKTLKGKSSWDALEVGSLELKRMLSQKLLAKSFLKYKTESMAGIITDQEAQAYYDKNRVKFGSMPFASFRENIKSFLSQQQLQERLRAWFEVIKRKYKVRNLLQEAGNK